MKGLPKIRFSGKGVMTPPPPPEIKTSGEEKTPIATSSDATSSALPSKDDKPQPKENQDSTG